MFFFIFGLVCFVCLFFFKELNISNQVGLGGGRVGGAGSFFCGGGDGFGFVLICFLIYTFWLSFSYSLDS